MEYAQIHVLGRESSDGLLAEDESLSEAESNASVPNIQPITAKNPKRTTEGRHNLADEFAGADTMRFSELWSILKKRGWTSVYGSGLIERFYLLPGVDKHTGTLGVTMFGSDEEVRQFICREYLGEEVIVDDAGKSNRRKRLPNVHVLGLMHNSDDSEGEHEAHAEADDENEHTEEHVQVEDQQTHAKR